MITEQEALKKVREADRRVTEAKARLRAHFDEEEIRKLELSFYCRSVYALGVAWGVYETVKNVKTKRDD
ncbi:hypothetical protein [Melghirimyces algeriensis]|uniref:Uncharacterized protein n=1 Tax=Melghirimyces algeriensis TaxID=910412 RepID=A0A521F7I4_9BACL|nr:hypothetical protein [Melghirimyces algeriensis]SMO92097.1 hypothetical protein SAMN06264849_11423 [Melghirimyces algeriensis]